MLATLESEPEVAANTIIIFTSDHGEYGASHGLRGKGASGYEEGIRVPLMVKDPRGILTRSPERLRTQLTSSVDVAPLLLTIATGSQQWRSDHHYAHIAGRHDLASILADPDAPGRQYILHATDEIVTEFAIQPYAADAPLHVVAMRTGAAKYVTYSHWEPDGVTPLQAGEEAELYDYSTAGGRLEVQNSAGSGPLEDGMRASIGRRRRGSCAPRCRRGSTKHAGAGSPTISSPPRTPRSSAIVSRRAPAANARSREGRELRPRPVKGRPQAHSVGPDGCGDAEDGAARVKRLHDDVRPGRGAPRSCLETGVGCLRGPGERGRGGSRQNAPGGHVRGPVPAHGTLIAPDELVATPTASPAGGLPGPEVRLEVLHASPERPVEQHLARFAVLGEVRKAAVAHQPVALPRGSACSLAFASSVFVG